MNGQTFFERLNNWVKNSITVKILSIGFLILILLIPAQMVESLIRERQYTREGAIDEVSSKWGYAQTITGPVLTVPYKAFAKDEHGKYIPVTEYAHFLPEKLNIAGTIHPEMRYRGIYEVVVYNSKMNLTGSFSNPSFKDWGVASENVYWKDAFLAIGIPDMRGIENNILLQWNTESIPFNPGVDSKDVIGSGVSAKVPLNISDTAGTFNFSFDVSLNGSKELNFIPVGKETNVQLISPWSTPSFSGAFLPDKRDINKNGFKAKWNVLHLNRNYPQQWRNASYSIGDSFFGVTLLVPVDDYQKTTRSQKYALMIISLTFLLFFFIEVMNKKRIHPIQYLLVGLAMIIFYTLLLSLSEHVNFNFAYMIASFAIITLIIVYCIPIFKNKRLTAFMMLILVTLYGFVFTILQLEDYALLMGSIGLFIVLAIVMYLSRKINWYSVHED